MVTSAAPMESAPRPASPTLSVVVPTLDEASTLTECLTNARHLGRTIVVSDGGSRDGTPELARAAGATVVSGPSGRGRQLNAGARATESDILVFLHADTRVPRGAGELIRRAIADGAVGGGFHTEFDDRRWALRLGNRLVALRTRLTSTPLGDQVQFVRRDEFEALGGFADWPILEDLDFARRLRRRGRMAILPGPAVTASRRFLRQGILRTVATNWLIWGLWAIGVSPNRLARLYRKLR